MSYGWSYDGHTIRLWSPQGRGRLDGTDAQDLLDELLDADERDMEWLIDRHADLLEPWPVWIVTDGQEVIRRCESREEAMALAQMASVLSGRPIVATTEGGAA